MLSDFTSAQLDIHGISIPPNDLPPDGLAAVLCGVCMTVFGLLLVQDGLHRE
jgi:hypothetical protein